MMLSSQSTKQQRQRQQRRQKQQRSSTLKAAAATTAALLFLASTDPQIVMTANAFVLPSSSSNIATATTTTSTTTSSLQAVTTVDQWKITGDGRLQGIIADSGDSVTTSPLENTRNARQRRTVKTASGSKYRLGTPANAANNANKNKKKKQQPMLFAGTQALQKAFVGAPNTKTSGTMPVDARQQEEDDGNGNKLFVPLLGAGAVALGAAIGSGTLNADTLQKFPPPLNAPASTQAAWESSKALLQKAQNLASNGIPLPSNVKVPKVGDLPKKVNLPRVQLPSTPALPQVQPLPSVPTFEAPKLPKTWREFQRGVQNFEPPSLNFNKQNKAQLGDFSANKYVPMPYLDDQIQQAQEAPPPPPPGTAAPPNTPTVVQQEQARLQQLEQENMARAARMQMQQQQQQEEQRRQQEAAVRLQSEAQEATLLQQRAQDEFTRKVQAAEAAAAVEQQAAREAAAAAKKLRDASVLLAPRYQKIADAAAQKAQTAQQDLSNKVQAADEARQVEQQMAQDAARKQRLAADAAGQRTTAPFSMPQVTTTTAPPAKMTSPTPSMSPPKRPATGTTTTSGGGGGLSTYDAWQQRQRLQYQQRKDSPNYRRDVAAARQTVLMDSKTATDSKSTFDKWQQAQAQKALAGMTTTQSTPAVPLASQMISGVNANSQTVATAAIPPTASSSVTSISLLVGGSALAIGVLAKSFDDDEVAVETVAAGTTSTVATPVPSSPVAAPPAVAVKTPPPVPSSPVAAPPAVAVPTPPPAPAPAVVSEEAPRKTYQIKDAVEPVVAETLPPRSTMSLTDATSTATPPVDPSFVTASATTAGNYLDQFATTTSSSKGSYSPFGRSKPMAAASDSLYSAPVVGSSPPRQSEPTPDVVVPFVAESAAMPLAASTAAYMSNMDSTANLKASYSPFGSSKPAAATSGNNLYSPPATALDEAPVVSAPQPVVEAESSSVTQSMDSYLGCIGGGSAPTKTSYSPFGAKPVAATVDSLYAPASSSAAAESAAAEIVDQAVGSVSSDEWEPRVAQSSASYLEAVGGSPSASLKASYSPFGSGKPMAADSSSNSLYAPAAFQDSAPGFESMQSQDTQEAIASGNGGPYLKNIGDSNDALKASYSPFGSGKPSAAASSGLTYEPATTLSPDESSFSAPEPASLVDSRDGASISSGLNYMQALGGNTAPSKTSYSPFGSGKPSAASTGMMYEPAAQSPMEAASNTLQDQDIAQAVAELGPASTASYMSALGGDAASTKSSYSPFGSGKPSAASTGMTYEPSASSESLSLPKHAAIPEPAFMEPVVSSIETNAGSAAAAESSTSFLASLGDGFGSLKASYSPFGGGKPQAAATSSAVAYAPPPASTSAAENGVLDGMSSSSSFAMPNGAQDTSSAAVNGASYLASMGGGDASGLKQSYSPFGGKGFASTNGDSLYNAPQQSYAIESNGAAQEEAPPLNGEVLFESETSAASSTSYLEAMGGDVGASGSPLLKQSYSPFGSKPAAAGGHSLYNPPS